MKVVDDDGHIGVEYVGDDDVGVFCKTNITLLSYLTQERKQPHGHVMTHHENKRAGRYNTTVNSIITNISHNNYLLH